MPLNNGNSSSAGVYTGERDNSARASAIATSIGGIVGPSNRGPVGVPTLTVDNEDFRNKFGAPDPTLTFMHLCAEAFLLESSRLMVTRVAVNAKLGGIKVTTVNNFSQTSAVQEGLDSPEDILFDTMDIMYFYAENPGNWNNNLRVVLYPDTNDLTGDQFILNIYEGTSQVPVETYKGTVFDKLDGYGNQLSIENQLAENSGRVRVLINEGHPSLVANPKVNLINAVTSGSFTLGSNGDTVTNSDIIEAWDLYEDPEEVTVNILINAGYTDPSVQLKMAEICEQRDDCFAVLDMPSDQQESQAAINYRRNTLNLNSSYAAIYSPDLKVRDTANSRDIYIPPSGHVAAAYARTDNVAASWFAPAGLNRGQLDVLGVKHIYKQGHRDAFDDNQINPVRFMSGHGIVIWGQETLQAHKSAMSNINVRRLLMLLKNSIRNGVEIGVYEPHDEFLRVQLRTIAENFLNPIKRGRGLYWFEVICSDKNNTPETIAAGDVMLDVYLDPVLPAKRIHLNAIVPKTGQIKFAQELINSEG
jgi:hypothetical protein